MPEVRTFGAGSERPRAVAVGCGGGGCNALRQLPPTPGLDVVAVNDLPHPSMAGIKRRLLLPKASLRPVASMDARVLKSLATTTEQTVAVELGEAELVVPLAGLGGDVGSWGANVVARVAALKGATAFASVTTPFSAEGQDRRAVADEALRLLRLNAHGTLALSNDPLLRIARDLPFAKAFEVMSRISVQPLCDLMRVLTNVDLPTLKAALRNASDWQLGIGEGLTREHPELAAVDAAFRSPWIRTPSERVRQVLLFIALPEPDERVCERILHDVNVRTPRASVLWGSFVEPALDAMRVTLLAGA